MSGPLPPLQRYWDWRAAGNFIGGGTGSGLLIVAALAAVVQEAPLWPAVPALAFIAAGLALVWSELGRPWRFLNVLFNPRTSWMSREAIVALPLFALGAIGIVWSSAPVLLLAGVVAGAFVYCQARMLTAAKGIPVWRSARMPGLILTTALVEGFGAFLVLVTYAPGWPGTHAPDAALLLVLLVARLGAWEAYRRGLRGAAPRAAIERLQRAGWMFVVAAHALPGIAAAAALLLPGLGPALLWSAALLALLGGWQIKLVIVTAAACEQGYALVRTPARGAGTPGPGARPGWD